MSKPETPNRVASSAVLNALREWSKITFENEESFVEKFAPWAKDGGVEVIGIHFSAEQAKVNYLMNDGQHIVDSVKIGDWLEWASNSRISDHASD